MKLFLTLVFYILLADLGKCADICFDTIQKLAEKDHCLSSRVNFLVDKALASKTGSEFVTAVKLASKKNTCNGDQSNCGLTMGYLSEAFVGLEKQFEFFKKFDGLNGTNMGFQNLIGEPIRQLFQDNKNSSSHLIYLLRHTGTEDHVWIIEQLANEGSYRIYQSYHDAYSLKAWLSGSLDGLFEAQNGDIKIFVDLKKQVNDLIGQISSGKFNLTTFDDSVFVGQYKAFEQFAIYVRDYGEKEATEIFKSAWEKYGKGKLISWTDLDEYLQKLVKLTEYFDKTDSTADLFSAQFYNDWKMLFGAANPVNFPGMPANAIMSMIAPGRTYRFEVKEVDVTGADCLANSRSLLAYASIPTSSASARSAFLTFRLLLIPQLFVLLVLNLNLS